MPSLTVNICVFTLVLLSTQQFCDARPHSKTKRETVKDYLHPLSADHFEKDANGKYHLKKSAHRLASEVTYAANEKVGEKSVGSPNDLKSPVIDDVKDKADIPKIEKEQLKELESGKMDLEISARKPIPPHVEEAKVVKVPSPKPEMIVDETVKKTEINMEKAPFTPVDPKFVVPPKPDSKDEIEVKTNLPPTPEEEKVDEKVAIGQIPHLYPRLIPIPNNFRVPILIPIHKITYGTVSVVPIPPAGVSDRLPLPAEDASSDRLPLPPIHDVSDRLPMSFEDDIIGEGGPESDSIEDAAELAAERKKETGVYPVNPLPVEVHLPLLSFSGLLKDLKDVSQKDGDKESKVVDVLGKKYLMQSNMMKYPSKENGHTFIRFLSVKPLEKTETDVLKEAAADKSIEEGGLEVKAKAAAEEYSPKKDELLKSAESLQKAEESKVEEEKAIEMVKEPEILKAEETQIQYKIEVPKEIPAKEAVGTNLQKEGKDLVQGQTENTEVILNDEKMVEMEHSFVQEVIKTDKGEKDIMSEGVESKILKTKPSSEEAEMDYDIKTQETKVKTKSLKGDDGIFPEEEDNKMTEMADSSTDKKVGGVMTKASKEVYSPEKKKKDLKAEEKSKSKKNSKEKKSKKKCTCEEEEDSDSDYSMEYDDEDDYY